LVLVQWQGLSPDDSSWQKWDYLCVSLHFEDTVGFARVGIDKEAVDGPLSTPKPVPIGIGKPNQALCLRD